MANYRFILGVLLVITCLNVLLYIHQKGSAHSQLSDTTTPTKRHHPVNTKSAAELLKQISPDHDRLFVIEPSLLRQALGEEEFADLKWRFDLPDFTLDPSSITLGMFAGDQILFSGLHEVARVEGIVPEGTDAQLLHLFAEWRNLKVHIVLFHHVNHFLWIGKIPESQLAKRQGFKVHFGTHEEIYDPFALNKIDLVQFPDEIAHFISQMPTSKFMSCPPERKEWLKKNGIEFDIKREEVTVESIVSIKSLMKELRMEFWALCGTLLGWYRQCGVIPYTTDNDFSTWPKYLQGEDISSQLQRAAPKHSLRLFYRFGEPRHSMEYSFKTRADKDKVDMFFTYRNSTHFLLPFHIAWKHVYQYSIYPQYDLCSMELLGYKLLAPCQTEKILLTEYGPSWDKPKKQYDYAESPFNSSPQYPFPRNITQYTQY